jgi:sulfite exporter TauE/SafE
MCGGIVAAIAMTGRESAPRSRQFFQASYNLGRISTYTLMGVAAGYIGSSLDLIAMKDVAFWVFAAANLFVMLVGLFSALDIPAFNLFSIGGTGGGYLSGFLRRALSGSAPLRAYPLGLMLGFLPCGLVYAPLVVAAGSGSPLRGGAIMAAMGLGTLPFLLFFGTASTALSGRMRGNFLRLVGLFVALMGFAGLWRVLGKMGVVVRFPF